MIENAATVGTGEAALLRCLAMTTTLPVAALPFPVAASHPGVWHHDDETGAVVADAPAHTDLYINPGGSDSGDAESMLNAATLLGTPPPGDFQFSARVSVDFISQYDAGVLLIWIDERHWAKFCFEFSPAAEPMVVSVVTRERLRRRQRLRRTRTLDLASCVASRRGVRVPRIDRRHRWRLIRVFAFDHGLGDHLIGFEAQSPTGDGCTVTFDDIRFTSDRLGDLRDGT